MSSFIVNVTFDCADPAALAAFWPGATGYTVAEARPDFAMLRAPDKRGVRKMLFFRVPEPKAAKNRVHVDLASLDARAETERLVALGAALVDGRLDGSPVWREGNATRWVVMRDPESDEFCPG